MCKNIHVRKKVYYKLAKNYALQYFETAVVVIVLLGSLRVRKQSGGSFRRWFRIRCQNWKWKCGYVDKANGNFAGEISPSCTFDGSGGSFGCRFRFRCQNSISMHRCGDIHHFSQNIYLIYTFTLLSRDQLTYIHRYIHAYAYTYTDIHIYMHINRYIYSYRCIHR